MYSGLLIGKTITVLSSLDKSLENENGLVVNESKNLITVKTPVGKILKLPKSVVMLEILDDLTNSLMTIDGSRLIGTPVDRIKG